MTVNFFFFLPVTLMKFLGPRSLSLSLSLPLYRQYKLVGFHFAFDKKKKMFIFVILFTSSRFASVTYSFRVPHYFYYY